MRNHSLHIPIQHVFRASGATNIGYGRSPQYGQLTITPTVIPQQAQQQQCAGHVKHQPMVNQQIQSTQSQQYQADSLQQQNVEQPVTDQNDGQKAEQFGNEHKYSMHMTNSIFLYSDSIQSTYIFSESRWRKAD